ncbi:hypothetical protein [Alicyclobacillus shizuokensis]|uniref:hypothetical protein n=1 Tax=Alicyclobacillus shizuokensis TaxID=392014 RepID=UPI00082CC8DC|nr:hypothetical protein [Alicyclobacillus shizuokensis]
MAAVVITLDDEHLPLIEFDDDGVKRSFHITTDRLLHYIELSSIEPSESSAQQYELVAASPTLPPGTVKYAKMGDESEWVFLTWEGGQFDVVYHTDTFHQVPYPKMVFAFRVKGERLVHAAVCCYTDQFLKDDSPVYQFPYSNVHHGGMLCYFDNEKVKSLTQLQTFPYRWVQTPNNDHLYIQGRSNQTGWPLRQVFDTFQGGEFDNDILTPLNLTFSEWAEKTIRR